MYYPLWNRLVAVLMLCSLCLQGCRSSSQIPSRDVVSEKSHEASEHGLASLHVQSPAVFGSQEWRRYFGEVGEAPSLPSDIGDILSSPCPFWPEKKVRDTHLLVLIPTTVNGEPFSLNLLGALIKRPRGGGHSTKYRNYARDIRTQFGTQSPEKSYWVLMTCDVLVDSKDQDYVSQKASVTAHAKRTGLPYELPSALEAATAILSHYVRSGERLYTDNPKTWTRCQDLVDNRYPIAVGEFSTKGVSVDDCDHEADCDDGDSCDHDNSCYGVAGLWKF